jgi:hypothetical protein
MHGFWAWYDWPLTIATIVVWAVYARHELRVYRQARRYGRRLDDRVARAGEDRAWRDGREEALQVAMAATVRRYEGRMRTLLDGDMAEPVARVFYADGLHSVKA